MRKISLAALLPALLVLVVTSCSKNSGGGNNNGNESLTVSFSKNTLRADGFDEVMITVKDQSNTDVTSASTIRVNGAPINGNKFSTATPGTYSVNATKNSVTSSSVSLAAQDPGPSPFTQKIMVEDYTGTWCGYCPRVGVSLTNYSATRPNCIVVGVHGPSGSSDPYNYQYVTQLTNAFNISAWPTAVINRDLKWNEQNSVLDQQLTKRAPLGLSLESSVSGTTITVKTKVKFDVTTSLPMRVIVTLVEDGLVAAQTNYYAPTYGANPIANYTHNHVLRAAATDIFGDLIPSAQQTMGNTWEKTYTFSATAYNVSNCKIVATVIYDPASGRTGSLNTQIVNAGQTKAFD